MPLIIDSKIKPSGDFPAVDAADVLMPDGKRLTEAEFGGSVVLDTSLSKEGQAADAAAVGTALQNVIDGATEAFNQVFQDIENLDLSGKKVGEVTLETYIGNAVNSYIEDALGGDY